MEITPLKEILPPAKPTVSTIYDRSNDPWFKQRFCSAESSEKSVAIIGKVVVPPYLNRQGFVHRKLADFGDGGAFPEIHIPQYPLDMCRNQSASRPGSIIAPVIVDAYGNVSYDAIVRQNDIAYSQRKDIIPSILKDEKEVVVREDDEMQREIEQTTHKTKAAIEKVLNVRLSTLQPKNVAQHSSESNYFTCKLSRPSAASFNSGVNERIIRMVDMPVDPLEPPKVKHKKVPRPSVSSPAPVIHSPPRPVMVKDQQDWQIPPCISNWKNLKGYAIPLDKRLAANGGGCVDVQINNNRARVSESLYVAEQIAREGVAMRSKVQNEIIMKEKERKEHELWALAQKARAERTGTVAPHKKVNMDSLDTREQMEDKLKRDKIREEWRRERRLEAKDVATRKESMILRDRGRDVSEKVALGLANVASGEGGRRGEIMYDQRLFNQEKGMGSGFAMDDQYSVYDKGFFTAQPTPSMLYKPRKDMDVEMYGAAGRHLEKIKTQRFKPNKASTGTSERARPRDRPVEFDKETEETDPFGLDMLLVLADMKGKKALDNVCDGGAMRTSSEGSCA